MRMFSDASLISSERRPASEERSVGGVIFFENIKPVSSVRSDVHLRV
jgi:hypothetical protein